MLGTYGCETLRSNRKSRPEAIQIKKPKLKVTDIVCTRKEILLCLRYHYKRDVIMLTNILEVQVSVLSKLDWKTNVSALKPTCILEY